MFIAKSHKLVRLPADVRQYWCSEVLKHANVRRLADGKYRKTSILNNDVDPQVVGHGIGFVVEDSCGFKVIFKCKRIKEKFSNKKRIINLHYLIYEKEKNV